MVARDKEDLSGQQIGNYEIESHIVAREISDLFLARDIKLERPVFLEVLRVSEQEDEALAESFRARMETVSQLKGPHIAVVSDFDVTEDGYPYAVIDYFPGETLAEKLAELRRDQNIPPVIESLELTKQMAQALGQAHAAGLIHHDLRPENIMLREDGTPILIDLGVPLVSGTPSPGVTGTENELLDYIAPEAAEGKPLTRRSNIYSLGVILYELLAGHQPHLPNLPFDIFPQANMPKEEPLEEARPGLAGETYRLVRNCLWRQEWSRFETADEMITAIETAIFAEQELPKAATWTPKRGRSRVFIIPVVLILVALLAFFLLREVFGGRGTEVVEPTRRGTPSGTLAAGAGTPDVGDSPSRTPDGGTPTDSSLGFTISVLSPAANREFFPQDTINFDWFWPTLPDDGDHFAVFVIDGDQEHLLGTMTEPNNGVAYRLSIPVKEIPATGDVALQVRLQNSDGSKVFVSSNLLPLRILTGTVTPTPGADTSTPTTTATPTPTVVCVVAPPPGWIQFTIRQGDSLSNLAQRADIPVESLIAVNCLPNDVLSVGQRVWVPANSLPWTATPSAPASPVPPTATRSFVTPESPPATSGPQPTTESPTTAPPTESPATEEPPTATAPPP